MRILLVLVFVLSGCTNHLPTEEIEGDSAFVERSIRDATSSLDTHLKVFSGFAV